MNALKTWFVEVGLKIAGPSAIRGAILGISGWLLAKNGVLASFGIISNAQTHTLTVHWDQISSTLIAAFPALLAALIKIVTHHGSTFIQGQGGSK